jgi:hypothetical protein
MARRGRPLKEPAPGERVPLSLRITPSAKKKLEAAAELNGRSLSQEAEYRIERSFDREDISKRVRAELRAELRALMSEGGVSTTPKRHVSALEPKPKGSKRVRAELRRLMSEGDVSTTPKPDVSALEPKPKGRGKDETR